jgi:hypothetical protein
MNWPDAFSDLIKIGGGGLFAYIVARFNYSRSMEKTRIENRWRLYEDTATALENLYQAFNAYMLVGRTVASIYQAGNTPSENQTERWKKEYLNLTDEVGKSSAAEAKMLLLRDRDSANLLRSFAYAVERTRNEVVVQPGGMPAHTSRWDECAREVERRRTVFYEHLANKYDNVGAEKRWFDRPRNWWTRRREPKQIAASGEKPDEKQS